MKFKYKTVKARRREFLDDLVKYYSKDPLRRAFDGTDCSYRVEIHGKVRKCAIGRHIPKNQYNDTMAGTVDDLVNNFPNCLPKSILDLGLDFLCHCQALHDRADYWYSDDISADGRKFYRDILQQYC